MHIKFRRNPLSKWLGMCMLKDCIIYLSIYIYMCVCMFKTVQKRSLATFLRMICFTLNKVLHYVAPKRSTDLLAPKIITEFKHILVLIFELLTIFWCNLPLIMV